MSATLTLLSQHLVTSLDSITELQGAVSVGIVNDPKSTNDKNIPIPFASVHLAGERNLTPDSINNKIKKIETIFAIAIYVKNGSEDILNNTSFPLLDKIRETIDGSTTNSAFRWVYLDGRVASTEVDRIIYVQRYSIVTPK